MLLATPNQSLVMRHGSFCIVTASIGLKTLNQTWRYWSHLKGSGLNFKELVSGLKIRPLSDMGPYIPDNFPDFQPGATQT